MSEPASEAALIGLAGTLARTPAGGRDAWSADEQRLLGDAPTPSAALVAETRGQIRAGADPLGEALGRLRPAALRRASGATYTPPALVSAMVEWAAAQGTPARVVDAGAGSGRFILAAAARFPAAALVAVERDPLAALLLRANAAVLGLSARLTLRLEDYQATRLPPLPPGAPTLFLGNPPYLRHHGLTPAAKDWYRRTAAGYGIKASQLAGLHLHFFLKNLTLARPGDWGVLVTAAEWLDVGYGSALRQLLAGPLGGVMLEVLDPAALPFSDAVTTAALTGFRVGERAETLAVRAVATLDQLGRLGQGRPVPWAEAERAPRWSVLVRPTAPPPPGWIELGSLFAVHRGQATGANALWIAGPAAADLPQALLPPTVTKARELIAAGGVLAEAGSLRRVVDLPVELDSLPEAVRAAVARFLAWAEAQGAAGSYLARHRPAWWAVGLKPPAPILSTYMARRPPVFVANPCGARHLNIAHGLYPRQPLSEAVMAAVRESLNRHSRQADGRAYAGGLTKFEPGDLMRLKLPDPFATAAGG